MNITVETQPNCRAVFRIEIPTADVQQQRSQLTDKYTRFAKLPGFRPGKAPRSVVAKKYENEISNELKEALVRQGYQKAAEKKEVEILNVIDVKEQSLNADESFSFTLEVSTVPKFELPEYKGIAVKLPRIEVNDADIDHEILHLQERFQKFNDLDRAAALGDFVVTSYTGTIGGEDVATAQPDAPAELKQSDGEWFRLTEEESHLPGFFAGLVGISKDEERTLKITLPEDYAFEALRGKEIELKVKAESVKGRELPEVDDEFAKKFNPEWDVTKLKEQVRELIQQRRQHAREESFTNQVISHVAEKLEFELPQDAVNREAQRRTNDIAMNAMRQGVDQGAIMEAQEQIVNAATEQAQRNVKVSFILGEIAKNENIKVTEDQIRRVIAQISVQQKITPKKLLAQAQKNNLIEKIREDLLLENTVRFLRDNAAVEEVDPEPEDCGHDHSHP